MEKLYIMFTIFKYIPYTKYMLLKFFILLYIVKEK